MERPPTSVYRLQLEPAFGFEDARRRLPYLHALGIDGLYLSPCMTAAPGSRHGYDVCDPERLSGELGGETAFHALTDEARNLGMSVLLDWVPNHMATGAENPWWTDLLENGVASPFARFFDVEWAPAKTELANKVLLPVLPDLYGRVLENNHLSLAYGNGAIVLRGAGRSFPIAPETYPEVLGRGLAELELPERHADKDELLSIMQALARLPGAGWEDSAERVRETAVAKKRLAALTLRSEPVRRHVERAVCSFSGRRGEPDGFDALDKLLSRQHYRLAHWKVAAQEINYRRFFNISELVGVRMEEEAVFRRSHAKLLELIEQGRVQGVRLDHIDGLYDPAGYLKRLQEACSKAKGGPFYVVVEKILQRRESLPADWPVAGTVGYEFLNALGGLFVDQGREAEIDQAYEAFTGHRVDFDRLVHSTKKLFAAEYMASELHALGHRLDSLSEESPYYRDYTRYQLTLAVREVVDRFPIYRTYIAPEDEEASPDDEKYLRIAVEKARRDTPALDPGVYDFLLDVLLLKVAPPRVTVAARERYRDWVLRFQQLTGPIMAKGLEDTALYANSRLLSLNEVGGDPTHIGVSPQDFHKQNGERAVNWPAGLLTTSTHDTKRSEDARSRISSLSELAGSWRTAAARWSVLNAKHKTEVDGKPEPSGDTEYFIYQTLLAVWPEETPDEEARHVLLDRLWEYCLKAVREAKQQTNWVNPRTEYEDAIRRFLEGILDGSAENRFLPDFEPLQARVAELGRLNALSQLTLKLGSPGVVDVYQGTELWSHRLVDPDNRRPVDYGLLEEELQRVLKLPPEEAASRLFAERRDGGIKLLLLQRGLALRRRLPGLFVGAEYLPLRTDGPRSRNVVAFARRTATDVCLAAGGRFFSEMPELPLGTAWAETVVLLPASMRGWGLRDAYTGRILPAKEHPEGAAIDAAALFEILPCALLSATR